MFGGGILDWQNEHWVKLFTRPTPEWLCWPWQSRVLLDQMLRIVDKSGQVGLGKAGVPGLSLAVHLPLDVVEIGLAGLLEDGCVTRVGQVLTIENFVEAQEARTSDKMRQQMVRDRRKAQKLLHARVTARRAKSPIEESRGEESRGEESRSDHRLLSAGADAGRDRVAWFVARWNETALPEFGKVATLSDGRRKKALPLLKQLTDAQVDAAISNLNAWSWRGKDGTWKPSFDYLLQDDNLIKFAEGSKGGKPSPNVRSGPVRAEDMDWANQPLGKVELK